MWKTDELNVGNYLLEYGNLSDDRSFRCLDQNSHMMMQLLLPAMMRSWNTVRRLVHLYNLSTQLRPLNYFLQLKNKHIFSFFIYIIYEHIF